jgi:uncharacterized Rossmann fold enzyme
MLGSETACCLLCLQVAALSRNVIFEGDEETSASYAHGAIILIHTHGDHPRAVFRGEQVTQLGAD